jgi:hypothetical protein
LDNVSSFSIVLSPPSLKPKSLHFVFYLSNRSAAKVRSPVRSSKGDKVWLLYHIPYGIDAYNTIIATGGNRVEKVIPLWQAGYQETFLKLLNQYRITILFTLAGHSHMDEFRLTPDGETGRSSSFLLVTPAISPVFQNKPGLQVLSYDRKAFSILDYTTHRLDLAAGSSDWRAEYRFSRTRSLFPVTRTTLETLSRSLQEEEPRHLHALLQCRQYGQLSDH